MILFLAIIPATLCHAPGFVVKGEIAIPGIIGSVHHATEMM
jgi:hypothetical protein